MKRIILVILAVLVVLAQSSWLPAVRPFGVVPNLALVLVVLVGLEGTASRALVVAVAGGIILDLASGVNFGLWTGTLVLAALVTGVIHRLGLEVENVLAAAVIVAGGTFTMAVVVLAGLFQVAGNFPADWIAAAVATEIVLNLVVMIAMRPLARWLLASRQPGGLVLE